jgi:hypothetical protein
VNELNDEKSAKYDDDSSQNTDKVPSFKQPLLQSKSAPQELGRMNTRERLLQRINEKEYKELYAILEAENSHIK